MIAIVAGGNADIAGVGNLSPVTAAGQWRVGKLAPAFLFRSGGGCLHSISPAKTIINPMKINTKIIIYGLFARGLCGWARSLLNNA